MRFVRVGQLNSRIGPPCSSIHPRWIEVLGAGWLWIPGDLLGGHDVHGYIYTYITGLRGSGLRCLGSQCFPAWIPNDPDVYRHWSPFSVLVNPNVDGAALDVFSVENRDFISIPGQFLPLIPQPKVVAPQTSDISMSDNMSSSNCPSWRPNLVARIVRHMDLIGRVPPSFGVRIFPTCTLGDTTVAIPTILIPKL